MYNVEDLVYQFEQEVSSALTEIHDEVPELAEYTHASEIDSAIANLSAVLYRKIEELQESKEEKALDDLADALSSAIEFYVSDFDGDHFYLEHKETGLKLTVTAEIDD